ncbi:hypothetical protein [Haloferula sp.]|uniref:hypothetical protein n=1 Tax=Haloferula sp. TaxID=2497595 RepID=UPI003C7170D8
MILAFDISELPGEALTVLFLLLISLISWIKDRFLTKPEEPQTFENEEMREVIWRRQMGETGEETLMPWEQPEAPSSTIRFDQPEPRAVVPTPPPLPPKPVKLSRREEELANSFERSTQKRGRRTSHRRQIDRMLRSPSAAKDAILLMEILGKPVALKDHQAQEI